MIDILVRVIDAYVFRKTADGLRFLMLKRAKTKRYEHLWQGVAGKIEAGETAPQAAIRELNEETGLKPKHMFIADHVSRFYETHGDRINLVPVFGIEVDSEVVILSEEHSKYKWVTLEEAQEHLVWRGQKRGIQVVNEMVLSNDDRMRWSEINFK
ncbi:MAG: NUDIX domain-containing protein [Planctomycetia bacterium]|nr:NUDIX domain-containing protein [Planctomycetia bacterium]